MQDERETKTSPAFKIFMHFEAYEYPMHFCAVISENIKNNMQKNKDISRHILKQRFIIFLRQPGLAATSFVALILNPPDTKTHIRVYTQKMS